MIDKLENTTIQDLAFAKAFGFDMKDLERLDIHKQKNQMQNLAFKMQIKKETITQEEANRLNEKYNEIVSLLENEYDVDLSCDYMINFNSFVPENSYYNRFAY